MQIFKILLLSIVLFACNNITEEPTELKLVVDSVTAVSHEVVEPIIEPISPLEQQLIDQGLVSIQDLDPQILTDL